MSGAELTHTADPTPWEAPTPEAGPPGAAPAGDGAAVIVADESHHVGDASRREWPRAFLEREATSIGFFRAVDLIESMRPDASRVGGFASPDGESVRFRAAPTTSFPTAEIRTLTFRDRAPADMEVTFFGLTGPSGVLPQVYTEHILENEARQNRAFRDFLDLFNHRLASLFYRAWRKTRRGGAAVGGGAHWLTATLRDLLGFGTPSLRGRLPMPVEAVLLYAGLLGPVPRSATALRLLLADYFGVTVEIEEFVGAWAPLARSSLSALGDDTAPARLGESAVLGDEVYDVQAKVRVRLGPLTREQYARFLPGGDAHDALRALVRYFDGNTDFELQLVLKRTEVPGVTLGEGGGAALGWTAWLHSAPDAPMARDPADTVLQL